MSVCTFIASDNPLPEHFPQKEYPCELNIDNGTVSLYDGDADDNYYLKNFIDTGGFTDKKYAVTLEWNYYTEGRGKQIVEYIKFALKHSDSVELWHVSMSDYWEYEERPFIHRKNIRLDDLKTEHIRETYDANIWNKPDKKFPERPSFYCLSIKR